MNNIINTVEKLLINNTKECIAILIVIITIVVILVLYNSIGRKIRKRANTRKEKKELYIGFRKYENAISKKESGFGLWLLIILYASIFVISLGTLYDFINLNNDIWKNINGYPLILLGVFATEITFLGIIAQQKKDSYIGYDINDLLDQSHILEKQMMVIRFILLSIVDWIFIEISPLIKMQINDLIFGLECLLGMLCVIATFILVGIIVNIIDILFGSNIEHKVLDNLYIKLKEIQLFVPKYNWTEKGLEINARYLANRVNDKAKKINFKKITTIQFKTNLINKNNSNLRIKSAFFFCFFFIIVNGVSTITILLKSKELASYYLVTFIILFILSFIVCTKASGLSTILVIMFYERSSYYIERSSILFRKWNVSDFCIRPQNKYAKYIRSCKNLISLFCISVNDVDESKCKIIFNTCKRELERKNNRWLLYIMDYYFWQEHKTHLCNKVILNNIDKNESEYSWIESVVSEIDYEIDENAVIIHPQFDEYRKNMNLSRKYICNRHE